MTLTTHLIVKHELPENVAVGYGSRFTTARPTRLGVIAMGYGDGYPRVIHAGKINIQGQDVPIVGRVSMDMFTVDLTDLTVNPPLNTEVTLWGNGLDVDEIARSAGTISYELFTRLSMRPTRHIVD
jgi:alanine racemase